METIERNTKLQTQLIDDLLDISRILQGKLTLNVGPTDLAVIVEAAKETVRLAAEAKSIQIETKIESTTLTIMGDFNRLQQVVWNLLSNAVKFTPADGRVEVKLKRVEREGVGEWEHEKSLHPSPPHSLTSSPPLSHSYAQITVSDTGKGISPEFLPHIFEYFRQADSSTTRKFGG